MSEYYEPTPAADLQAIEKKTVNTSLTALPEPHLTGLKLAADVSINGLTLNTIDENDVLWVVSDIDGWWNLPEPELPDLPRGWGDGSYDAVGRWANRIITLNGSFLPQRPSDAPAARDALIQAIALVKIGGWLIVYEDKATDTSGISFPNNPSLNDSYRPINGGVSWVWNGSEWAANGKAAYVRISGAPIITSVNARGRHDFSIMFKAVDPIKYEFNATEDPDDGYSSTTITTSSGTGQATISNGGGNVSVPIIAELSSGFTLPGSSATIKNTTANPDQTITIIGETSASNRLEIDTYNREVLDVEYSGATVVSSVNGRAKVSVLVDWIYLEPGDNVIELAGFPTGGTCTIYWRSGWIG
jgi:hypothetical protein